ncbi:MAG: TetR/AcrR family transcriptional regulator [Polyangiaceae bacterium]|nr:TetR/AcrR family transcriptional regulator [Polyangiaceae bacterium]
MSQAEIKDPRSRLRREYRRAQIAQAAHALFESRGYAEASVDLIAEHAGLSKSTLYTYFTSKEEIVAACFASVEAELHSRIDAAQRGRVTLEERLVAAITATIEHIDMHRGFLIAMAGHVLPEAEDASPGLVAFEGYTQKLAEILALAPHPIGDPKLAARLLATLVLGALALRVREGYACAHLAADEAASLCQFALHGLVARREKPATL